MNIKIYDLLLTSHNTPHSTHGNEQCLKLLLGVFNTEKRGDLSLSLWPILQDSMRSVATLESQLKLLSASTLSMSSSSSLGSLSSSHASSKVRFVPKRCIPKRCVPSASELLWKSQKGTVERVQYARYRYSNCEGPMLFNKRDSYVYRYRRWVPFLL